MNSLPSRFGVRLICAAILFITSTFAARLAAENNPGIVVNGPVLKEGFTFPGTIDFDATPAPPAIQFGPALEVPSATGIYARLTTTLGDIFIEFVNGATLENGGVVTPANATVNRIRSYLATGSAADASPNTFDGVFFHRASVGPNFSIIQSGGFKVQPGLEIVDVAPKPPLKNQFLAANTRGTLAMARTADPDSATNQWFINLADNSQVFGTDNTGGYVVFARILGNGIRVADAIGALPTWGFNPPFNELPLRGYNGQGSPALSQFINVRTFREVPASAVPAGIRTPSIVYSIHENTNPAALSATVSSGGALTLRPTRFGGRSQVTVRAQVPSGHHWDHVITTTKLGPPAIVKAPPTTATARLGTIATLRAEATGWPFYIKWQRRSSPTADWEDLVEDSFEEFTPFVGTNTRNLQIYLYGETTPESAESFALSGSQFRYVVSGSPDFDAPRLESRPTTFTVTTSLAFRDRLPATTTAALGSTISLTARATPETLPYATYQWERRAPGSTVWEPLVNARAAIPAQGDDPAQPAVLSPYSGVDSPTLTIRLNGTTPASGTGISTAATLALDRSQYRCVIRHDRGLGTQSAASTATTLRITTLRVGFSAQPPALVVGHLGGNASLSVTARPTAANTPVSYQWQRLPAGAPRDAWVNLSNSTEANPTRYTGVHTRTLTINLGGADVTAQLAALDLDEDRYRCIITVPALGSATSSASRLRVVTQNYNLVTAESHVLPGIAPAEGRSFSAAGLPRGLTIDPVSGAIAGIPNARPGLYRITITTRQDGVVVGTRAHYIEVRALTGNNAGGFEALLLPDEDSPPHAKLVLTISANGAFTGTLSTTVESSPLPFRGNVVRSPSGVLSLANPIDIRRPGTPSGRLYRLANFSISAGGVLSVSLSALDGPGAEPIELAGSTVGKRLSTFSPGNPAPWARVASYSLALTQPEPLHEPEPGEDAAALPAGSGFATAPVDASGRLIIRGRLPDGAPFTASLPSATDGSYRLFARPYGARAGAVISSDFRLTPTTVFAPNGTTFTRYALAAGAGGETYWSRPEGVTSPAGYRAGFGPLGLDLLVQPWIFFNGTNLGLLFTGTGSSATATIGLATDGPVLSNAVAGPPNVPASLRLNFSNLTFTSAASVDPTQSRLALNERTGALTGSLVLSDGRRVNLLGVMLVPSRADYGQFLPAGTVTAEGLAIIPAPAGSTAGPSTERFRLHQPGARPAP